MTDKIILGKAIKYSDAFETNNSKWIDCELRIEGFRDMGAKKQTYYWTVSYSCEDFSGSAVSKNKFPTKQEAKKNFEDTVL